MSKNIFTFIFILSFLHSQYQNPTESKVKLKFNNAWLSLQQKRYELSIEQFSEILILDPKNWLTLYYLGKAFYYAGYINEAIGQWQNIIKIHGQNPYLINYLNDLEFFKKPIYRETLDSFVLINTFPKFGTINQKKILKPLSLIHIDSNNKLYILEKNSSSLLSMDINGNYQGKILLYKNPLSQINKINPNNFLFKNIKNIINIKELFLISHFQTDNLIFWNQEGKQIKSIGKKGIDREVGKIVEWLGPYGTAVTEEGNLFVSDSGNSHIDYINTNGELIYSFGERGQRKGQLLFPTGLFYSKNRKLLIVADSGNNRVSLFSKTGVFLDDFGQEIFKKPHQVLLHPNKNNILFVLDSHSIYICDLEKKIYQPIFDKSHLLIPINMNIDQHGILYVINAKNQSIEVFIPANWKYNNLRTEILQIDIKNFPDIYLQVNVATKNGLPIFNLNANNFEVIENNQLIPFSIVQTSLNQKKTQIHFLIENSINMSKNQLKLKQILNELLILIQNKKVNKNQNYQWRVSIFDDKNITQVIDYTTSLPLTLNKVIKKLTTNINPPVKQNKKIISIGKTLKYTINEQINHSQKKAVIIITSSTYGEENFFIEKYTTMMFFAKHNQVPIYIVYLPSKTNNKINEQKHSLLEKLSFNTHGLPIKYENTSDLIKLINHLAKTHNSIYTFKYKSINEQGKPGIFRNIQIKSKFRSMVGTDPYSGYPIP